MGTLTPTSLLRPVIPELTEHERENYERWCRSIGVPPYIDPAINTADTSGDNVIDGECEEVSDVNG